ADVGDHFVPVHQADFRHLAKGRIRLLRGGSVHLGAYTATLRTTGQCDRFALVLRVLTTLADELLDGWHALVSSCLSGVFTYSLANTGCKGKRIPFPTMPC